tara:strand:+ start:725 stop:910 length:186 start_codon:yes stop_codon:yes gene_type:complete
MINYKKIIMSKKITVLCPNCGTTTTITIGVEKSGTSVGRCYNCKKNIKVQLDGNGNIKRVK